MVNQTFKNKLQSNLKIDTYTLQFMNEESYE